MDGEGLELDNLLDEFEGDVIEEGDKSHVAKNVLERRDGTLSSSSQQLRAATQPGHLQNKWRTQVCRHWMRGACMKGEKCEFLHKLDESRMPDCPQGAKCPNKDNGKCLFKHVVHEATCSFYRQGFCPHGKQCKSEHVALPLSELPVVGDYSKGLVSTQMRLQAGKEWYATDTELRRMREAGPNAMYKSGPCKHFMQTGGPDNGGVCPYGDDCQFAHGPLDSRAPDFAKQRALSMGVGARTGQGLIPNGFALRDDDEPYRLFMLKCNNIMNLARSLKQKVWRVRRELAAPLNEAFYSGVKVLLLFSQAGSNVVQGCATMLSPVPLPASAPAGAEGGSEGAGPRAGDGEDEDDDEEEDPEELFSGHFGVSWDRGEGCMRDCDMAQLENLPNSLHFGVPCSLASDGQEIASTPEVGGMLLRRLWASDEPYLEPEEYMGGTAIDVEAEASQV